MFITNVGEMPIDIFGDYISDCLGEEWTWEYLPALLSYFQSQIYEPYGNGCGYSVIPASSIAYGNGETAMHSNLYRHAKGDGDGYQILDDPYFIGFFENARGDNKGYGNNGISRTQQ